MTRKNFIEAMEIESKRETNLEERKQDLYQKIVKRDEELKNRIALITTDLIPLDVWNKLINLNRFNHKFSNGLEFCKYVDVLKIKSKRTCMSLRGSCSYQFKGFGTDCRRYSNNASEYDLNQWLDEILKTEMIYQDFLDALPEIYDYIFDVINEDHNSREEKLNKLSENVKPKTFKFDVACTIEIDGNDMEICRKSVEQKLKNLNATYIDTYVVDEFGNEN